MHPIVVSMLVFGAVAVTTVAITLLQGDDESTTFELVVSGVVLGAGFAVAAYFGQRPVAREHMVRLGIGLAAAGWIIGLVVGAGLFLGGLIVIFFAVNPLMTNFLALRKREQSARARAVGGGPARH